MALLTKTLVSWNQPRRFREQMRQMEKRVLNWWVKPVFGLGLASVFLLQWYAATLKDGPQKPPPFEQTLVVAICGGIILAYGTFWLAQILPDSVAVNERGFQRGKRFMPFDQLAAHAWFPASEFSTLLLVGKDQSRRLLGVPKNETEAKLRKILSDHKIPEDPSLKPFVETELNPSVWGGLVLVAPLLIVVAFFGLFAAHTTLVTQLKREAKITDEQARQDWLTLRTKLVKEGVAPEKLPANPYEQRPASDKMRGLKLYFLLAPFIYLIAMLILGVIALLYRVRANNLQALLEAKSAAQGRPINSTTPPNG